MTAPTTAASATPKPPVTNRLGHEMKVYKAAESTLCAGCGHDSITSQLIKALFESNVEPWNVAKMSGIVIRADLGRVPAYHLLADIASADYLWPALLDAMKEFDGGPVGLAALRSLEGQTS